MSQATAPAPVVSKLQPASKMPDVELGQIVWWYPGGDRLQEPHAAIVTRVGIANVCCSLVEENCNNLPIREGVWHIDDPRARRPELAENGAWDYTPRDKELKKLLWDLRKKMGNP